MILSRRKTHFFAIAALCIVLPVVYLLGLVWRPSIPKVDSRSEKLFSAADFIPDSDVINILASEIMTIEGMELIIQSAQSDEQSLWLILKPSEPLSFSNVLVYWQPQASPSDAITEQAVLLGQLSGTSRRRFKIPTALTQQPGNLLLYSQGQQTAIAQIPLPASLFP